MQIGPSFHAAVYVLHRYVCTEYLGTSKVRFDAAGAECPGKAIKEEVGEANMEGAVKMMIFP